MLNSMVPALDGQMAPGIRCDVVIKDLQLAIEVEGPQRFSVPLSKVTEEDDYRGRRAEVILSMLAANACEFIGPAIFRRRLLRRCGWRVITVRCDENEENAVDAWVNFMERRKRPQLDKMRQEARAAAASGADPLMDLGQDDQGMYDDAALRDLAPSFDPGFSDITLTEAGIFGTDVAYSKYEE